MYNTTLKRKTPLKAKTQLRSKTSLKAHSTLKTSKSLRQCTIDKYRAKKDAGESIAARKQKAYKPKHKYESIFTDDLKKCFITGSYEGWHDGRYYKIHKHHIFGAANKANSEKYHFIIPLRDDWHDMADYGVHFNKELDLKLKRLCQTYWLMCYGTKEEFIKTFNKWW